MSMTGLEAFDKTLQTTNAWLREIGEQIDSDRQRCYQALGTATDAGARHLL
jgi:hypothetical protein